jgi:predicted transcriptional regulator of viral defense system
VVDVAALPATFTTSQASRAGVQFRDLYAARDSGVLVELSRGVFRRADAPQASYPDLLAVAYRAPRAVVCLVSAASVHDLTDELPLAVQIAVPKGTWPPKIAYPQVEVFTWSPNTFDLGLQAVEAAPGESVRVYSPARTVVDLMRLRGRVGESVAHIALRRYLARPDARVGQLIDLARALDVLGPVRAAVDVLTAS